MQNGSRNGEEKLYPTTVQYSFNLVVLLIVTGIPLFFGVMAVLNYSVEQKFNLLTLLFIISALFMMGFVIPLWHNFFSNEPLFINPKQGYLRYRNEKFPLDTIEFCTIEKEAFSIKNSTPFRNKYLIHVKDGTKITFYGYFRGVNVDIRLRLSATGIEFR